MKASDIKDYGLLAIVGIGAYLLYKAVTKVPQALTTAGQAIGSGLFDFFNPSAGGITTLYDVAFPDGSHHAIASNIVASDGTFTVPAYVTLYAGQDMQIVTDKSGNHVAMPP